MNELHPPSNGADRSRTDITRFMGPFPDPDHPFLGTSFDRVAQKHDYVYQLIVHNSPRFILAFGIDYAVSQLIAVRTSGKRGHFLVPDTTLLLSHTLEDNWEQMLRTGLHRQWFTLGNLEFAKRFDLERDIDQLWSNTQGYRNLFGRKFRLKQRIIITDPPPPHDLRPRELEICGEHNKDLLHSQCVYIDECSARVLPPEVLSNPFGAAGALLCGDGMTEGFMTNAITQWYNGGRLGTNPEMNRFVLECLALRPGLIDLYQRVATKLMKEETMANGTHRETTRVSRGFIDALNLQLGVVPDINRLPRVRKNTQDVAKRVTERVTKRVTEQVTEQVTQDVTQKERVKALLDTLNAKSIKLTPKQRTQLAKVRYQDLPSMQTAVRAKDAADFMRHANLKRVK